MKIWFTADTHFWHTNIISGLSDWGFRKFKNVEQMNDILIERWNTRVGKEDVVFHLGDFALCKVSMMKDLVSKLNGNIIIIKGNHDDPKKLRRCGFSHVLIGTLEIVFKYRQKKYKVVLKHRPQKVKDTRFIICGHQHEKFKIKHTRDNVWINVGVDQWNYFPVSLEEVLDEIDKVINK
jgi:calcineurin-like phosphoesterase family protein